MIKDLVTDRRYRQRKWVAFLLFASALIGGLFTDRLDGVAFNSGMAILLSGYGFMAFWGTARDRGEDA